MLWFQRILAVLTVLLLMLVGGGSAAQVRSPHWVKPSVVDRHGDLILAQGRVFPAYRPAPVYRPPPMAAIRPPVFRPPTPIIKPPVMRIPRIGPPVSTLRAPAVRLPGPASRLASLPRSMRPSVLLPGRGISTFVGRKSLTLRSLRPDAGIGTKALRRPLVASAGAGIKGAVAPKIAAKGALIGSKPANTNRKAGVRTKFNSAAWGAGVRRSAKGGGEKPPGPPLKLMAANDNSRFMYREVNDNVKFIRVNVRQQPKAVTWKVSSGVKIKSDPKRTTTILGDYGMDMKYVISALKYPKTYDLGAKNGGFNVLNTPNNAFRESRMFWRQHNKPFLDAAISRNDIVVLATKPTTKNLYRENPKTGATELTGFGREFFYLSEKGYTYDPRSSTMLPNG